MACGAINGPYMAGVGLFFPQIALGVGEREVTLLIYLLSFKITDAKLKHFGNLFTFLFEKSSFHIPQYKTQAALKASQMF